MRARRRSRQPCGDALLLTIQPVPCPQASAHRGSRCSVDSIPNKPSATGFLDHADDPVATAARFASYAGNRRLVSEHAESLGDAVAHAPNARVRSAALGALVRNGSKARAHRAWTTAVGDAEPSVRRRAAELAPKLAAPSARPLLTLLRDPDPLVAESAAFACGEVAWVEPRRARVVGGLITAAQHADALVRESAVAALGSLGDPSGLPAILAACGDQPSVRRRAVLALAPFDAPEVDAALVAALTDSDWQTRQAAEDLSAPA